MATSNGAGGAGGPTRSGTARGRATGRVVTALLVGCGLGAGATAGLATAASDAAGASGGEVVHVSTAQVPHVGTVLTTGSGLTLYYFTVNPPGKSTCTGACAQIWPPFTAAKGAHISGPNGVKGLSLISVGSGQWQVAFHDHALYRFNSDTKKGQAGGQDFMNKWYAAPKSGIPASASAAPASAPPTTASPPTTAPPMTTTTSPPPPTSSGGSGGSGGGGGSGYGY